MIISDIPKPVTLDDYHRSIDKMVETLRDLPGLLTIYQIGGLSAPGISDIDMVAVFEDDASYALDPQAEQSRIGQYLFTHCLFATSRSLFEECRKFTSFHNYRLLYGEDLNTQSFASDTMKRQLANEFLVRMLINRTIEREYGICRVRSMLLHGKALLYDMEFLGVDPPRLSACLHQVIKWREEWFKNPPTNKEIKIYLDDLWHALVDFLNEHFGREPIFLPKSDGYSLGRNVEILPAPRVSGTSHGPKLPWAPPVLAKKLVGLHNRLNRIVVEVPITSQNAPEEIVQSFSYTRRAWEHSRRHLPHFMPLTSSLILN